MKVDVSGVGVEMGFGDDAKVVVVALMSGGLLVEVGVKVKDFIVVVDGVVMCGKSLYEVVDEL